MKRKMLLGAAAVVASTVIILIVVTRPSSRVAEAGDTTGVRVNSPATAPAASGRTLPDHTTQHAKDDEARTTAPVHAIPARRPHPRVASSGQEELPVERAFMRDGSMDVDAVRTAMKSDNFDALLDRFEEQIQTDVLAMEMSSLYRTALQQHAAEFNLDPGRAACGIRFCTGSVMSSDPATWEQMTTALIGSDDFPLYLFGSHDRLLDSGQTEHRFIFSIDPTIQVTTGTLP